jgi:hypothetical protein
MPRRVDDLTPDQLKSARDMINRGKSTLYVAAQLESSAVAIIRHRMNGDLPPRRPRAGLRRNWMKMKDGGNA